MSSLMSDNFVPPSPVSLEVLLTSDASGQLWNACAWDPYTGAALTTYKGSATASKTMTLLGDSFLISAQPAKPVLNVWQVHRHEQQASKVTTPGASSVGALAASPSGKHLVAAVGEQIFVWQTSNGALLRVLESGHYQPVTCLAFTDDGSHFVSAGKDGNVLVWSLLEIAARQAIPGQKREQVNAPVPRHTWSDSKLAVTDLHISGGGVRSRVATASLDQSCKVFCLLSGRLLLDVQFAARLHSVTMDNTETNLFVGSEEGAVFMQSIVSPPRNLQMSREEGNSFVGHKAAVTILSMSLDGQTLASGSDDCDVKLWSVLSKECLRTLEHKGRVTMVKFITPVNGMLKPEVFKQSFCLSQLQKVVFDSKNDVAVDLYVRESCRSPADAEEEPLGEACGVEDGLGNQVLEPEDVKKLKEVNLQLYQYAVKNILEKKSH